MIGKEEIKIIKEKEDLRIEIQNTKEVKITKEINMVKRPTLNPQNKRKRLDFKKKRLGNQKNFQKKIHIDQLNL